MNWLLKLVGYRGREYRGNDFSVRIEPIAREAVSVAHTREGKTLKLAGERIGKKYEGISLYLPPDVEATQASQIVHDLQTAFVALRYHYIIARSTGVETISEAERQAALSELRAMGWEIETLPDGGIRQTRRADAPLQDAASLQTQAPRLMSLIQTLRPARERFETLAKSKDF